MAKHIEDEVVYHYDIYPTEEDLMGQTSVHGRLIRYLMDVLTWLFWGKQCALYDSLNFYQTPDIYENPLSPDVAVIKGVEMRDMKSWRVGKDGPPPQVVFEILSPKTWKTDIEHKPTQYALMGVQEYFAYDPDTPLLDRDTPTRFSGWQLDTLTRQTQRMALHPNGGLWSSQLDSWLVPGGPSLYLYDRQGHLRLTQAQAEAQRAEAEKRRADAEAKRAEALAEKLRSLGIDPNHL